MLKVYDIKLLLSQRIQKQKKNCNTSQVGIKRKKKKKEEKKRNGHHNHIIHASERSTYAYSSKRLAVQRNDEIL